MGVEIAITVAREETRVAVLDNGVVTDLFGDRAKHKDFVGNIFKGKVAKVLPGMQAAFVDIGLEKAAFMHVSDLSLDAEPGDTLLDSDDEDKDSDDMRPRRESSKPIEQLLSEGQELMVQISKGPIGTKGPRVTTNLVLPGRYLVLLPPINGATAFSGAPSYFTQSPGDPFKAWDYSFTFDYMPKDFITFRLEFNRRMADVPYFTGPGGITPVGGNTGPPGSNVPGFTPDLVRGESRITTAILVKY